MERAERFTICVASLAVLLAGAAFSYAHLRQIDSWAVETFAGSVWRLAAERFSGYDCGATGWVAAAIIVVTALASGFVNFSKEPHQPATEAIRGNHHE